MTSATEMLDTYLRQTTQPQTRSRTDVAVVVSGKKDRVYASDVRLSEMRAQGSAHQNFQGRHSAPVQHSAQLSRSSISKPLQDLVNRCNKLNSSLALSQQGEPVLSSNDFMSDLAALRTRYLANTPIRVQPGLQNRNTFSGAKSSYSGALEAHWQRLALPSAVQGSSDFLLDSVSERSASGHMQPQHRRVTAWQSQENASALQPHSAMSRRIIRRSQPLHPQVMKEEHRECFLNPAVYCPEGHGEVAKRRSCSSNAVEQDSSQASYAGSVPGQRLLPPDLKGRHQSPVQRGMKFADSQSAVSTEDGVTKQFSAAGYMSIDHATPSPLHASRSDLEPYSSIEPIRTPLTDCLRDFFARRSASREMESQEQADAQLAQPQKEQEGNEHAGSSSCLEAAAAEARIRTAEALQAVQNVRMSSSYFPGPSVFFGDSGRQHAASTSPHTEVVKCSNQNENITVWSAQQASSSPETHQICRAAQRVREIYPEIFQPGQSPSFCSSPGGLQLTSYTPDKITTQVCSSSDGHIHSSCTDPLTQSNRLSGQVVEVSCGMPDLRLVAPESPKLDTHPSVDEKQPCAVTSAAIQVWKGQGGGSEEDHIVIAGLSERAQKLLAWGRALQKQREVSQPVEDRSVDASVNHWAAHRSQDSNSSAPFGSYCVSEVQVTDQNYN